MAQTTIEWTARRFFGEAHWREPLSWNAEAAQQGHRRNVFCASMADVFEDHPDVGPARERLWHLIEQTPWLNWLLLTKRPELIGRFAPWATTGIWPDNVWLGTSIGLQQHVAARLDALLSHPSVGWTHPQRGWADLGRMHLGRDAARATSPSRV